MRRLALVAVLSAIVVSGCSRDEVQAGRAVVEIERGSRVLIGGDDTGLRSATGRHSVRLGTQVKVLDGAATVTLPDGARLDLRRGSEVSLASPVVLEARDLLVVSGKRPLKVAMAGSEVMVDGVARLTRDLAVSAATYRGSATLHSAARSLVVPAFRQAEIPSLGVLPARPVALSYDTDDTWDRRYLGEAMELAAQLTSRARGFTSQLDPGFGRTPGFYRVLLPALEDEPAFGEDLLADARDPGDTLIGAAIAVTGKLGSFSDRWAGVFGFRAQGATWGLVALDQQVNDTDALVRTVDLAIGRQSFAFAPTPSAAPLPPPPPPAPPAPAAPAPAAPPAGAPPAAAPPQSAPTTAPPLVRAPPLGELLPAPDPGAPGLLAPLLNVVNDTLGGLLSGNG